MTTLATTPTTITTSGSATFPPNDSWGTGTVWQATAPTLVAGESLYQSDGIYSPTTGNTVWNVPYLSNLKVGSLSAISANLGTITAGSISGTSLSVGTTPAVSGTTMTGAGAIINTTGTFALGNATTNISYNGTQMTLNGNVVATGNINNNAVTLTTSAFTSANYLNTSGATWQDAQTITLTTTGKQVYIASSGAPISGVAIDGENTLAYPPQFRLVRDATVLMSGGFNPAMSYSETPTAGTYVYTIQVYSQPSAGTISTYAGLSNRSLFGMETKR